MLPEKIDCSIAKKKEKKGKIYFKAHNLSSVSIVIQIIYINTFSSSLIYYFGIFLLSFHSFASSSFLSDFIKNSFVI